MYNPVGGFSSYQSEYPYDMTLRRGSVISAVGNLANTGSMHNTIFVRNIFCEPVRESYPAYLVCKSNRIIKKSYVLYSNETNRIELDAQDIKPDHYLVTKGFLGVPIYLTESADGHLSFEHTHPPHSNIHGVQRFPVVARLKNELLEIIG